MAVVVTGGYGQCGSWVARMLADQGKDVIIFNRSKHYLDYLEAVKNKIRYFKGDVLDLPSIFRMFREYDNEIEGIIHFAGLMGGPYFNTNPHLHISINTMGTMNFLEAARIFGKKKFIYVSSGAVYGERSDIPNEDTPISPSDLYGSVKASSELLGLQYAKLFGLDFIAVRIFFAYGPGRMPSELYPTYQAIFGGLEGLGDIKLESGADQYVDFTYVKDIAKGIIMLFNAESTKHKVYNISSGSYHKVPDVINLVSKYSLSPRKVEMGPGKFILRGPSLDITRITEEFGFKADYSIEDGIKEYSEWIRKNKK